MCIVVKSRITGIGPLELPRKTCRLPTCQALNSNDVRVKILHGPRNSRFIFANLDINAPIGTIWDTLTDYNNLDEFIPSLVENEILEKKPKGAVLRQVGQQNIALGVKFCAAVVLEIKEHLDGLRNELCWNEATGREWNETLWFPSGGLINGPTPRDITFELISGDFLAFKGLWRMQNKWRETQVTQLSYSVFVRPQFWLPVALIQGRISSEAKNNLKALKQHAESSAPTRTSSA